MLNWSQIWVLIQANPAVSAAMAGMVLSALYILLMMATKLGDVKPGIQAFVLSGVIHLVMVALWGSLTINQPRSAGNSPDASEREILIPVSAAVVDEADIGTEPDSDPSGTGPNGIFKRGPQIQREEFSRLNETTDERVALEGPQRERGDFEPRAADLPELPSEMENGPQVSEKPPEQALPAEIAPRVAATANVELGEETSESRDETDAPGAKRSRSIEFESSKTVNRNESNPVRKDNSIDSDVKVPMVVPPTAPKVMDSTDIAGPRRADVQVTQRRTGAAPTRLDAPGLDEDPVGGTSGEENASASDGEGSRGKFSRVGAGTNRMNSRAGSGSPGGVTGDPLIARRVQEFVPGTQSTAPRVASVGPSGSGGGTSTVDRPGIATPEFDTVSPRKGALTTDTYKFRNPRQRKKVALKHGATQDSEQAVELSLQWLARHQHPEGYWDADGFDSQCPLRDRCWGPAGRGNPTEVDRVNSPHDRVALETAGQQADTGLTALVVLTFLGAGYTQEEGQYADQIDRALRWMIRQQQSDGYMGGKASHYEKMYCHGMATYALGEACGMITNSEQNDPQLRRALGKAVRYIIAMQNPRDGGWRYLNGNLANQESDMSMFGWQLMALKSAEIAGIPIPEKTRSGLDLFLIKISQGKQKGLASYRQGEKPKPSMTAEALFCRQVLGMRRDTPASQEAIEFLNQFPPKPETQDLYHWYYGTLATYQYGGEPWEKWNDRLRDTLVATQLKTGHSAGSWDPRDNWSRHGGRLYSTALSTMCLEVYYRFLPLYQSHDRQIGELPNATSIE